MTATWRNSRLAGRLAELDGVRGLAILFVLVGHYFTGAIPLEPFSWQSYALVPFRLAWTGVDLFFVLSGFLIGGILLDAKSSDVYYRTFYSRRAYRILPIYYILLAVFFVGLHFVGPTAAGPLREIFNRDLPTWSYPVFLQNFFMTSLNMFGPNSLSPTWSLAVEEQFYLLLPLLIRNLSYRGITWLALASILCAPVLRLFLPSLTGSEHMGLVLLPARMDALGFGVLVALVCRNESIWKWLASHREYLYRAFLLLGSGVAFLTVRQQGLYVWGLSWITAFYATLLLLLIVNPGRIEAFVFRSNVLTKLGTVAYAVYIFHQGINAVFFYAILGRRPSLTDWSSLAVTLFSLVTVIVLSALSWRLLEKPLIRHAHAKYRYAANHAHAEDFNQAGSGSSLAGAQ